MSQFVLLPFPYQQLHVATSATSRENEELRWLFLSSVALRSVWNGCEGIAGRVSDIVSSASSRNSPHGEFTKWEERSDAGLSKRMSDVAWGTRLGLPQVLIPDPQKISHVM